MPNFARNPHWRRFGMDFWSCVTLKFLIGIIYHRKRRIAGMPSAFRDIQSYTRIYWPIIQDLWPI